MTKNIILIAFIFLSTFCSSQDNGKDINVLNKSFNNQIGVFFLSGDPISTEDFDLVVRKFLPHFQKVNDPLDSTIENYYTVEFIDNPQVDFTPPDLEYLKFSARGLSKNEQDALQEATGALAITFSGSKKNVYKKQENISMLLNDAFKNSNAVLVDYNTVESFNAKSWKEMRIDNFGGITKDVTNQIAIHAYRDGNLCRAVTLGMNKFCLPDISIKDFSCSNQISYSALINAIAQTLSERPKLNSNSTISLNLESIQNKNARNALLSGIHENAVKSADIKLESAKPEQGDYPNIQYRLVFDSPGFGSPQEEQNKVITKLFGSNDGLEYVNHNDALLKASAEAKKQLPKIKERFDMGLEPGFAILLKAPFTTDGGGNEWMWVEVTTWNEGNITGILQNDPFEISNLKAGSIVSVKQKDIFDYILYKPGGSYEGNETGKIIESQQH